LLMAALYPPGAGFPPSPPATSNRLERSEKMGAGSAGRRACPHFFRTLLRLAAGSSPHTAPTPWIMLKFYEPASRRERLWQRRQVNYEGELALKIADEFVICRHELATFPLSERYVQTIVKRAARLRREI